MEREHIDIIEVFLKKDLDIPLTDTELLYFNNMDDTDKQTVFDLVNNYSYIEELVKLMNKIKNNSSSLPINIQQEIYEKCERKKKKLEEMNSHQTKKTYKM